MEQGNNKPQIRIYHSEPSSVREYLIDFVKNRHLLNVLARQEIKGLYAQTYLGILWAVLRPLLLTLIFTAFFKGLLNIKTQSPYYLFAFTGMISWNFFSTIVTQASGVMIQRRDLIKKLHFPKLILPLYKIIVSSVEAGVGLIILIIMVLFEGIPLHLNFVALPFFIFLNICCGLMLAVWVNALSIRFRDLTFLMPTLIGTAIWLTPVFYPTSLLSPRLTTLLYFNPMAGVIEGYRYALLGESFPAWPFFISIGVTLLMALAGIWYLIQVEDEIIDYV